MSNCIHTHMDMCSCVLYVYMCMPVCFLKSAIMLHIPEEPKSESDERCNLTESTAAEPCNSDHPGQKRLWVEILTPGQVAPASSGLLVSLDSKESSESPPGLQALYLVNLYSSHRHRLDTSVWSPPTVICPALLSSGTEAGTCISDVTARYFP